jgi:hypothetical protein
MSDTCPKCGGKLRIGRVKQHATFTERRRDCCKCDYGDKVHVRVVEEVLAVIEVAKRAKREVRKRTFCSVKAKKL